MKPTEFITQLLKMVLGEDAQIEVEQKEADQRVEINLTIPEDSASLIIGAHGETLSSIETITRISFLEEFDGIRLIVDVNGYRERRQNKIQENAIKLAYKTLETGQAHALRNLNSYERFLVHSAISEDPKLSDIITESEDDYDERVLVIKLIEQDQQMETEVSQDSTDNQTKNLDETQDDDEFID